MRGFSVVLHRYRYQYRTGPRSALKWWYRHRQVPTIRAPIPNLCMSFWNLQSYRELFTFKCRQCLRLRPPSAPPCLLNIQPSPHCFDSQNKKKWLHYTLNTLHQTLHNTLTIQSKHEEPAVPETPQIWNWCVTSIWPCCVCHWPWSQHSRRPAGMHKAELQRSHPERHLVKCICTRRVGWNSWAVWTVDQCKKRVKYFKHSGLQNSLKKSFKQSIKTRWNSNYVMLDSILQQHEEISTLLLSNNQYERIAQINANTLKTVVAFLKLFKDATNDRESNNSTPRASLPLPWSVRLIEHCQAASLEPCVCLVSGRADGHQWQIIPSPHDVQDYNAPDS